MFFFGGLPTVVVSLGGDPAGEPTGEPNGVPVTGRYASGFPLVFTGEYGGEQNWALASQVTVGERMGVGGTGSVSRRDRQSASSRSSSSYLAAGGVAGSPVSSSLVEDLAFTTGIYMGLADTGRMDSVRCSLGMGMGWTESVRWRVGGVIDWGLASRMYASKSYRCVVSLEIGVYIPYLPSSPLVSCHP